MQFVQDKLLRQMFTTPPYVCIERKNKQAI